MTAATETDEQMHAGATDESKQEKEDRIFGTSPQPRVNVSATQHSLQFYLARARKILRLQDECVIGGLGQAMGLVVEVVEILKREKIAEIAKVETSMVDGTSLRTRFRKPKIEIHLNRGEYATLVSDYRRRKVTDIFESFDPDMTGKLPVQLIEDMNLPDAFFVDDEKVRDDAVQFLDGKTELNLPDFIRYASIIINPLLLEMKFKQAVDRVMHKDDPVMIEETTKGQ